jgi:predicted transposase/invertase (TIGR01784 family)
MIDPTVDVVFKYIFGEPGASEGILMNLLNDLLFLQGDRRISDLTYVETQHPPALYRQRGLILDLRVKDERGITYNIEIQRQHTDPILHRAIYHASRIFARQLNTSDRFSAVSPVVILLLCNYRTYPDPHPVRLFKLTPYLPNINSPDGDAPTPLPYRLKDFDLSAINHYTQRESFKRKLTEAERSLDLLSLYLVELPKSIDRLTPDQQRWVKFLRHPYPLPSSDQGAVPMSVDPPQFIDQSPWLKEAYARLECFAQDPQHRDAYERELMEIALHNTMIDSSFEEGMEKGKKEGIEEGIEKGIEKGIEEGIEKGMEDGRIEALKSVLPILKAQGLTEDQIAQQLGLSDRDRNRVFASSSG